MVVLQHQRRQTLYHQVPTKWPNATYIFHILKSSRAVVIYQHVTPPIPRRVANSATLSLKGVVVYKNSKLFSTCMHSQVSLN